MGEAAALMILPVDESASPLQGWQEYAAFIATLQACSVGLVIVAWALIAIAVTSRKDPSRGSASMDESLARGDNATDAESPSSMGRDADQGNFARHVGPVAADDLDAGSTRCLTTAPGQPTPVQRHVHHITSESNTEKPEEDGGDQYPLK